MLEFILYPSDLTDFFIVKNQTTNIVHCPRNRMLNRRYKIDPNFKGSGTLLQLDSGEDIAPDSDSDCHMDDEGPEAEQSTRTQVKKEFTFAS